MTTEYHNRVMRAEKPSLASAKQLLRLLDRQPVTM
jgi:hypothetical protein